MDSVNALIEIGKSYANKWIEASRAGGMCDQEKIEILLQKRSEYLGIKNPRKIVWCATPEELQEKLSKESLKDLLYDLENNFTPYKDSLEKQIYKQFDDFLLFESPSLRLTDLLSDLRREINKILEKRGGLEKLKVNFDFTEVLWTLYVNEGQKINQIARLKGFWDDLSNLPFCAYLDCLWQCLPHKEKVKNYFSYIGEARESGLGIYIPSKTAEYLMPIPGRFFIGTAKVSGEKRPKIQWMDKKPEVLNQSGAETETKKIIDTLILFTEKMRGDLDDKEIFVEIDRIVELVQKILPILKKEFPKIGLTWEIERTVTEYLPKIGNSYLMLSKENREKKREAMLEILQKAIRESLEKTLQNIEEKRVDQFEINAEFLRQMFRMNSLNI